MKTNLTFLLKPFMLCVILFTSVIFRLNAQETLFFQENFDNPTALWYHSNIITENLSKETLCTIGRKVILGK